MLAAQTSRVSVQVLIAMLAAAAAPAALALDNGLGLTPPREPWHTPANLLVHAAERAARSSQTACSLPS
jgi:hypothetical protein